MLTKVVELEVVAPFGLKVRFDTGEVGTHDCSRLVGDRGLLFEPLGDPVFFRRAFLEFGAPTWPNGIDLAPEWLRRDMLAAGELDASAALLTDRRARVAEVEAETSE